MTAQPMSVQHNEISAFKWKTAMILGTIQVIVAVISLAFILSASIISIHHLSDCEYYLAAFGYSIFVGLLCFCPVLYFISGGMALCVQRKRKLCFIKALLGMSIVSVIFAGAQIITSAFITDGAVTENEDSDVCELQNTQAMIASSVLAMLSGVVEMAISIWLIVLCGDVMCCKRVETATDLVVSQTQENAPNLAAPQAMVLLQQPHQTVTAIPALNVTNTGAVQYTNPTLGYPQHQIDHTRGTEAGADPPPSYGTVMGYPEQGKKHLES